MHEPERTDAPAGKRTGLDRRSFLTHGGGALLATSSLAAFLSACGDGGSDSAGTGTGGTPASGEDGKVGPMIVIGSSEGDPANLDAGVTNSFALLATVGSAAHAYLLNLQPDGNLGPSIASNHEYVSPTELTFEIRDDITFHNGRKLEPKDIKESYERLQDPKTASPYAPFLENVKSIAVDGSTVTFNLNAPYAPLLALTSQIPIIPIETADEQKTNPVGAGPFKFKEWQKDNQMDFDRFEDYFEADLPKVTGVRFLPRGDASALRSGFLSKEEDVALGFLWPDMEVFEKAGGKPSTSYLNGFQFFAYNTKRKPFDDPKVRQALSIGMDRKRFAEIENGPGSQVWPLPIDPKSPYAPEDPQIPYDLEKAKGMLEEAGVTGMTIEGLLVDLPLLRPIGPIWQDEFSKLGLKLKLQILPPADVIDRVITRGDYQMTQFGDAAPADPALFLDRYFKTKGTTNVMGYSNKELDEILTEAGAETDDAKRKELYDKALAIIVEDAPVYVWSQLALNTVHQANTSDFGIKGNYTFDWASMTKA